MQKLGFKRAEADYIFKIMERKPRSRRLHVKLINSCMINSFKCFRCLFLQIILYIVEVAWTCEELVEIMYLELTEFCGRSLVDDDWWLLHTRGEGQGLHPPDRRKIQISTATIECEQNLARRPRFARHNDKYRVPRSSSMRVIHRNYNTVGCH